MYISDIIVYKFNEYFPGKKIGITVHRSSIIISYETNINQSLPWKQ